MQNCFLFWFRTALALLRRWTSLAAQMDRGSIRHCQTVPGLARVKGGAPFPIRQLLPLQHHTMVYSMQPTHRAMHSRTGHGQATSEQI